MAKKKPRLYKAKPVVPKKAEPPLSAMMKSGIKKIIKDAKGADKDAAAEWVEADQALKKKAGRQAKIDALQDERDALIVASYQRTLKVLASLHGGFFSAENVRLEDGLLVIKTKRAAIS